MASYFDHMQFVLRVVAARLGVPRRLFNQETQGMEPIAEAIEKIGELAVDAAKQNMTPAKVAGPFLRNATLMQYGEKIERVEHDPLPKCVVVRDLDSLATVVAGSTAAHGEDGAVTATESRVHAAIYHNDDQVIAIFDDRDASFRDDKAIWNLTPSEKFRCLSGEAAAPRAQPEFVRWLVLNLRDECRRDCPAFLERVRNIKFRTADDQSGVVQTGRQSMGREIELKLVDAQDMPETIIFNVKRWADLDHVIPFEVYLDIDLQKRTLALLPLADQLAEAERAAHKWLGDAITAEVACPVYYGKP